MKLNISSLLKTFNKYFYNFENESLIKWRSTLNFIADRTDKFDWS